MAGISRVKLHSSGCQWASLITQHWFRYWIGAIRQQAFIWAKVDPYLCCHGATSPQWVKSIILKNKMFREVISSFFTHVLLAQSQNTIHLWVCWRVITSQWFTMESRSKIHAMSLPISMATSCRQLLQKRNNRDDKMLEGNLCDGIHIQDTSGQIGHYYHIMGYRNSFLGVVRDHFVYALRQWETMLQCNVISHWLEAFTKWSLCSQAEYNIRWYCIQQNSDRDLALSVISERRRKPQITKKLARWRPHHLCWRLFGVSNVIYMPHFSQSEVNNGCYGWPGAYLAPGHHDDIGQLAYII